VQEGIPRPKRRATQLGANTSHQGDIERLFSDPSPARFDLEYASSYENTSFPGLAHLATAIEHRITEHRSGNLMGFISASGEAFSPREMSLLYLQRDERHTTALLATLYLLALAGA